MGDKLLVQIVDAALAEANRKAGAWVVCKPGCTECCMGPFPISQADALRLRRGLAELVVQDPERAVRIRARVAMMDIDSDDTPCPVLDPETGTCDLYTARPITCRTFGPAIRFGEGALGVCELNFDGATDDEIAACAVTIEVEDESEGVETSVAAALFSLSS